MDSNSQEQNPKETLKFTEFEVKFKVEGDLVYEFKKLVSALPDEKEFIYLESDDIYYVKGEEFIRHRYDIKNLEGRQELTFKKKVNTQNNINRVEVNLRCDGNTIENTAKFCESLGFTKNFKIAKYVHIYRLKDATLPFYTVIDESGQMSHFIEIEVDEELLHSLTEEEAWAVVRKYETILAPLGVTPQKRLRKSLFEMYRKNV